METMLRVHRPTQDHWRRPRHHSGDAGTGDLNIFTSRYMWLPGDDAVGHYRSTFRYDLLYDVWNKIGRLDDQLAETSHAALDEVRVGCNAGSSSRSRFISSSRA